MRACRRTPDSPRRRSGGGAGWHKQRTHWLFTIFLLYKKWMVSLCSHAPGSLLAAVRPVVFVGLQTSLASCLELRRAMPAVMPDMPAAMPLMPAVCQLSCPSCQLSMCQPGASFGTAKLAESVLSVKGSPATAAVLPEFSIAQTVLDRQQPALTSSPWL